MKQSVKPQKNLSEWISIKEAAAYLSTSPATVRRLREALDPATRKPYLTSCKPSPRLILISGASLKAHRDAAQDLEFWEGRKLPRGKNKILPEGRRECRPQGKTNVKKAR